MLPRSLAFVCSTSWDEGRSAANADRLAPSPNLALVFHGQPGQLHVRIFQKRVLTLAPSYTWLFGSPANVVASACRAERMRNTGLCRPLHAPLAEFTSQKIQRVQSRNIIPLAMVPVQKAFSPKLLQPDPALHHIVAARMLISSQSTLSCWH